jgi:hypothetical protein
MAELMSGSDFITLNGIGDELSGPNNTLRLDLRV